MQTFFESSPICYVRFMLELHILEGHHIYLGGGFSCGFVVSVGLYFIQQMA